MSEKNKGGRPTKFKEEYIDQGYRLSLLGHTDAQLAQFFEVNVDTIYEWKKRHTKFSDALKRGKEIADVNVVKSLYKKACGYTTKKIKFATHEGSITDKEEYEEEVAPDTTAAIFWLKNRQPKAWRDKIETENTNRNIEITFEEHSD